jgi:hypothetical protein
MGDAKTRFSIFGRACDSICLATTEQRNNGNHTKRERKATEMGKGRINITGALSRNSAAKVPNSVSRDGSDGFKKYGFALK